SWLYGVRMLAVAAWHGHRDWLLANRTRTLATVIPLLLLTFCAGKAFGATSSVVTEGTYTLRQGTTNVSTGHATLVACDVAAQARSEAQRTSRTYSCERIDRVVVTYIAPPPPP